MFQATRRCS